MGVAGEVADFVGGVTAAVGFWREYNFLQFCNLFFNLTAATNKLERATNIPPTLTINLNRGCGTSHAEKNIIEIL